MLLPKIYTILLFLFLTLTGQAQSAQDLQTLQQTHQACLDQGTNMLGCTQAYYRQTDSLLNVVYQRVRTPLNPTQKAALKQELLRWLKERDAFFKKTDQHVAQELDLQSKDGQMIALHQKADFVAKRVEALLKKRKP